MARKDIHRPSAIIPENYEFVSVRSREVVMDGGGAWEIQKFNEHREATGGVFASHDHGGNCDVCGAWFIDYAIFYHAPTNEYIRAGLDCTAKIEVGHADDFRRVAQLRRAAAKRQREVDVAIEKLTERGLDSLIETLFVDYVGGKTFQSEGVEVVDFLGIRDMNPNNWETNYFVSRIATLVDMVRNLVKYGEWSEKQWSYAASMVEALEDPIGKLEAMRKDKEDLTEVIEGKQVVKGKVLSIKEEESYFGYDVSYTTKMLVLDERKFKVWVTVPKAIQEVCVGDVVEFTATLTRSDKDKSFGFGKRPSKASIVKGGE